MFMRIQTTTIPNSQFGRQPRTRANVRLDDQLSAQQYRAFAHSGQTARLAG
jgi:hypothetical protein